MVILTVFKHTKSLKKRKRKFVWSPKRHNNLKKWYLGISSGVKMPRMFYYFWLSSIFLETKHRKKRKKKRKEKKGKVIQSQELDLPRSFIASYHHLSFESLGHGSKAVSLCPESNPSYSLLSQSAMMISSFDSTYNGNPNRKRNEKKIWSRKRRKEGGKEDANNIFMFLVIYTRHEYWG